MYYDADKGTEWKVREIREDDKAVTRGSLGSCGLEEFHFGRTNAEEDRGQENEGGKCVYNNTGRERAVFHSPMGPSSIKRR